MDMGKDIDVQFTNDKEPQLVRYHEHGILSKVVSLKTSKQSWVFNSQSLEIDFDGVDIELLTILDDLSKEGYELVCADDGDYIFRSKNESEDYGLL